MNFNRAIAPFAIAIALLVIWFVHKKYQEAQWRAECIRNLRLIVVSKQNVAQQDRLAPGALVTEGKVAEHLMGRGEPGTGLAGYGFACPAGGNYAVNPLGSNPVCTIHGQAPAP